MTVKVLLWFYLLNGVGGFPAAQAHLGLTFVPSPHSGTSCALTGPYASWLSPYI